MLPPNKISADDVTLSAMAERGLRRFLLISGGGRSEDDAPAAAGATGAAAGTLSDDAIRARIAAAVREMEPAAMRNYRWRE